MAAPWSRQSRTAISPRASRARVPVLPLDRMAVDDRRTGTWVTYMGGRATGLRVRRCRLDIVAGPDTGQSHEIEHPVIRIGARSDNDLSLTDARVSGYHCEVRLDENGYRLVDMGSTNGTYVSSLRINDVYITPGTVIFVGTSQICFEPLATSIEVPLVRARSLRRHGRQERQDARAVRPAGAPAPRPTPPC